MANQVDKSILVVEDHPLYRDALVQILRSIAADISTVAVNSAEEGILRASGLPNLHMVMMDLNLPGMNGIEAIREFSQRFPKVPVVVLSASDDRQEANVALRAGARFFLSKSTSVETIGDIVRRVLSGVEEAPQWISPNSVSLFPDTKEMNLTKRQVETLNLLSKGYSNKEIGLRMGLAEITIKVHVSALFRQLGVVNRTQAVLAARRLGIEAAQDISADSNP